jgi:hypothetical protein
MKTPILGGTYVARSVNAANSRMVNLFPESVPDGGKEQGFLNRTPGLVTLYTVGGGPVRGMIVVKDVLYIASGTKFFKINVDNTPVFIGDISNEGQVSMASNGTQIFIACQGPSFIYNVVTNDFGQITDPDFEGALTVTFIDGYFIFNPPNSQKLWSTAIYDGTSIDPLDFSSAEADPDLISSIYSNHGELWVLGTNSIEVWYDAGNTQFPFKRIQGAFVEVGCAATFSVAKLDNSLFWLGSDARGTGMVYRSQGYSSLRISTHAVEWQIQNYARIDDAIGYSYQQDGHSFYVLVFPSANVTWVYDVSTGVWHERASWDRRGVYIRHRGNCQVAYKSRVLIGDFENGNVYKFDLDAYSDGEIPQRWLRSWRALPTGQNNLKRQAHHNLQLDCQSGVGTNNSEAALVSLRWSDDGGHTWSNYHTASLGKIGVTGTRVLWRRLGMTQKLRDRVYEITGADPVKITIMGAELIMSGTNG